MSDLWKDSALGTVAVEEAGASASGVSYSRGGKGTDHIFVPLPSWGR